MPNICEICETILNKCCPIGNSNTNNINIIRVGNEKHLVCAKCHSSISLVKKIIQEDFGLEEPHE